MTTSTELAKSCAKGIFDFAGLEFDKSEQAYQEDITNAIERAVPLFELLDLAKKVQAFEMSFQDSSESRQNKKEMFVALEKLRQKGIEI